MAAVEQNVENLGCAQASSRFPFAPVMTSLELDPEMPSPYFAGRIYLTKVS